jgi:hypothetical protein
MPTVESAPNLEAKLKLFFRLVMMLISLTGTLKHKNSSHQHICAALPNVRKPLQQDTNLYICLQHLKLFVTRVYTCIFDFS